MYIKSHGRAKGKRAGKSRLKLSRVQRKDKGTAKFLDTINYRAVWLIHHYSLPRAKWQVSHDENGLGGSFTRNEMPCRKTEVLKCLCHR